MCDKYFSLTSVSVVGAQGISRGSLTGPNEDNEYSTHLTFTPTLEQLGDHVVCVTAKDDDGCVSCVIRLVIVIISYEPCLIAKHIAGKCQNNAVW